MLKFLRLTIFLFIAIQASAQINFEKGYFIDNLGKRVDCLIRNVDWKDNPTKFDYKFSEDAESNSKTAEEVQEFGLGSHVKFIKAPVKINRSTDLAGRLEQDSKVIYTDETVFLKSLVEGTANLYYYEDGNLRRFFFSKADQNPVQLLYKRFRNPDLSIGENNGYRQQLLNAFKCYGMKKSVISKLLYKKDPLVKIFSNYNQCVDPNWQEIEKKTKDFIFQFSIRPGITSSSLDVTANNTTYVAKLGFRVGAELEVIMPFNRGKWSFLFEPTYRDYEMNNGINRFFPEGSDRLKVDYTSIEFLVGARHYLFLSDNSKLFIGGYLLNDLNLNSLVNLPVATEVKPSTNFAVGMGFKTQNKISLEIRYDLPRELFRTNLFNSEFKNISLIFGYTLF
jgi:hypothetical protein